MDPLGRGAEGGQPAHPMLVFTKRSLPMSKESMVDSINQRNMGLRQRQLYFLQEPFVQLRGRLGKTSRTGIVPLCHIGNDLCEVVYYTYHGA